MLSFTQILQRALFCRCPRCAQGALFEGFLNLKPYCSDCGLSLKRADSGDGPAVLLTFVLGFVLIPFILVFALHSDWPMWVHSVVWSLVIIAATLGTVRPAKALMVGLQFRMKPEMFEDTP